MTLVLGVIAFFIPSTEILKSSELKSTITGFAPVCTITFAEAQYVIAGIITSSPGPTPHHRNNNSIPAVQDETATVHLLPQYSVSCFSNSFVRGPVVIQPEVNAAVTSSITF